MRRLQFFWLGILWLILSGIALVYELQRRPNLVISWETETEVNTAGFYLYRSTAQDGPFERLNVLLIPAAEDPLTGGEYQYVDGDIEPGGVYYYQLEEVEIDGQTNRIGLDRVQAPDAGSWTVVAPGLGVLVGLFLVVMGATKFRGRTRDGSEEARLAAEATEGG